MHSEEDRIAAYLDGELPEEERAAFEQQCASDPALAAKVERWRQNDAALRQALPVEPVSDDLLARMGLAEVAQPSHSASAAPMAANDNAVWQRLRWPVGGALAASLAAFLWWQMPSNQGLADDPAFQLALESSISGTAVQIDKGQSVTPILSFVSGKGNYCREFAIGAGSAGQSGIACRAAGSWQVEALVKGSPVGGGDGGYQTARGNDTSQLDAVYERLGAGDPLTASKEKAVITKGWGISEK